MIKFGKERYFWLGAFFIFLLDQATKLWAFNYLLLEEEIKLNKWFSLHRIYNESFIMANYDIYNYSISLLQFRIMYALVAIILALGIIWVTRQPELKKPGWIAEFAKTGLFIILGGMWGNLFDRVFRKEGVIDFLSLNMFEETQPIINIADAMIYVGEFCVIMGWLIILINGIIKVKRKAVEQTI